MLLAVDCLRRDTADRDASERWSLLCEQRSMPIVGEGKKCLIVSSHRSVSSRIMCDCSVKRRHQSAAKDRWQACMLLKLSYLSSSFTSPHPWIVIIHATHSLPVLHFLLPTEWVLPMVTDIGYLSRSQHLSRPLLKSLDHRLRQLRRHSFTQSSIKRIAKLELNI